MFPIPNLRNQIKVVFFDIDETLIVKHKDYLPETVLPALKALKTNGIIPAIATGRSPCSIPLKVKRLMEEVGIELLVTMNGQFVCFGQKVIEKHPIPTEKIANITAYFDRQNIAYAFVSQDDIYVSAKTPEVHSALDPITTNYHIDKNYYLRHEVFQILPFYREDKDEQVAQSGILDNLKVVRWDEDSVDLFDAQGSKARGIQAAINYLGFTMENVMAFGDGLNDLEMMEAVGVGVAMGNAHDKLKAKADFITDHIEEQGIANFLRKSGLID
ncbi:Cof-type HAD-IIB family hydrolase [Rodentibacter myodis]|uniref:Hydrolase n=1 Tax=Rodentibacter myodis TaxID=1907939 RepID=A0A1V3JQN7_9PAST|nr:Cof-type HAD-IIB family hydrolase [Rodentibacter myodis]OOF58592.1 hydrolase [Rodentibacter myodis]